MFTLTIAALKLLDIGFGDRKQKLADKAAMIEGTTAEEKSAAKRSKKAKTAQ